MIDKTKAILTLVAVIAVLIGYLIRLEHRLTVIEQQNIRLEQTLNNIENNQRRIKQYLFFD